MSSSSSASSSIRSVQCVLDRHIVNKHTIHQFDNLGLSIFAPLCGMNRGCFVLSPPDGQTYSCLHLPTSFAASVGTDVPIQETNDVKEQLTAGNITASQAVDLIELLNSAVYTSTANVQHDPYACNLNGLAHLVCDSTTPSSLQPANGDSVIRAATLAGLFVPSPWATPHGRKLTVDEMSRFYQRSDFQDMFDWGLNTVVIPIGLSVWLNDDAPVLDILQMVLGDAHEAGLQAILALEDDADASSSSSSSSSTSSRGTHRGIRMATQFALDQGSVILAIQVPPQSSSSTSLDYTYVTSAREIAASMPLLVPINGGQLDAFQAPDANVFPAFGMDHTTVVADVASSTSEDDRMKLFYHESMACIQRAPVEYANCWKQSPMFISGGFDISIDNCVLKGLKNSTFQDYGQCDRFDETIDSHWWHTHRTSFAQRQLFAFEQGLGWTFASWKLYDGDDNNDSSSKSRSHSSSSSATAALDTPAKLFSLKAVAAAGILPSLRASKSDDQSASLVCLNPPVADFTLGDATLSPTPGPPPDCWPGWWNESIHDCTYWVPPVTLAPTPCDCSNFTITEERESVYEEDDDMGGTIMNQGEEHMILSFVAGFVLALLTTVIVQRIWGSRRSGYSLIPDPSV